MIATSLQTRKKLYMAPEVTRAGPCGPGDVEEKRTRAASSTEDFLVGRWSFVFCLLVRAKHQKTCWKLCVCRQSMSFLNWESWSCKLAFMFQFSSVQLLSHVRLLATPWISASQASLSITNYRSLLKLTSIKFWWWYPAISSSVVPFSSCPQSLPASGSFPMSQLFASGTQSIGVSASASVLPMNIQDLSPLGWTGWISLQSKGLSRVFSNTTVQKHQFFGAELPSQSNSHIQTWPLEKP